MLFLLFNQLCGQKLRCHRGGRRARIAGEEQTLALLLLRKTASRKASLRMLGLRG
jgi:hypothetical protein